MRYLIVIFILLSACGKSETNITGQVFVVTQSSQNVKLGLVSVLAIPKKDADIYLNSKNLQGVEMQKPLASQLQILKNSFDEGEINLKTKKEQFKIGLNKSFTRGEFSQLDELADKQIEGFNKLVDTKWHSDKRYTDYIQLKEKFDYFNSAQYYMDGLPKTQYSSKTDADGKYNLILPHGKYLISANSSRGLAGGRETYSWLIWVDTSSINAPVFLSNDNLFETKCKDCFQP